MGFLHSGHLSLMEASVRANDLTVTSIFVNPLQFGAGEDLTAYPRDLDRDCSECAAAGVDLVFAPSVEEMYPLEPLTSVALAGITDTMEGAARPTHFAGVATVVAKLFNIVGACRAYFGEKDWQQLIVVRRMAADLSAPVEVVGCPIVREDDGLAMSSRNVYLEDDQRLAASALSRALRNGIGMIENGETDPAAVVAAITSVLAAESLVADPDYVAVVDAESLEPLSAIAGEVRLLVAAQVGRARLLDNMGVWV
jgi:pantoate--beta-alanine ligase